MDRSPGASSHRPEWLGIGNHGLGLLRVILKINYVFPPTERSARPEVPADCMVDSTELRPQMRQNYITHYTTLLRTL